LWVRNVSFFDVGANAPDVATSSRKDMFLGLKIKNALGQSVNFDFDDSEEEEGEEDTTWEEYSA
jgi:hypothetical protein